MARSLEMSAVQTMVVRRAGIDPDRWQAARDQVSDSGDDWGYPLRSSCLFWEAVPAAEAAANVSPTDPYLADALWAATATQVFAGRLGATTATLLAEPWRATGLILPT
jgi:hypothetical protein